ncbi:YfhO family protein [Butyrivibrio sp. WCE2006]|uniref:YfhO family protein n=1 Tax=Butyrivibrio sp. WCE2006 TaxID=1410611 RepID=UPI00067939FC|nr:YfhO family protein [Butyrivibrio sp. WCE2006]
MNLLRLKCVKPSGILWCAIIGFITACMIFGYFIFSDNGVLLVCDDFNSQQMTFAQAVWNVVRYGKGGQWCWNLDLGSSVIGGFSFYNLGSPFYWIYLMFPKGTFPYLAGPLYIFKYVIACLTSYIYLRLFTKGFSEDRADYALIGALIYAFSGFQTVNLEFFHFHDVVAFFPLLLWGMETIDDKKKRPLFIFVIFINCLVNYFFFIQEVIFMAIYFVFRFWGKPIKDNIRKLIVCFGCGMLGVGMASILFIPSILYITGNTRSEMGLYLSNFVYDSKSLLYLIKGILLPGDAMRANNAVILKRWTSTSCYLPLFGLACVIGFIKKDRGWLQKLLIVLLGITLFPFAQSGFLLFTAAYQRWWYMLVLVMALATVKVLENPEDYFMSDGVLVYVIATIVFYLCIRYVPWNSNKDQMIFFDDRFTYYFVLAILGPIVLDLILRCNRFYFKAILLLTIAYCVVTTGLTLHYYRYDTDTQEYIEKYKASINLPKINDQYRYNSVDNVNTLTSEAAGIGVFSSTIENSSHDFNILLDIDNGVSTEERLSVKGLPQLLSGKYGITFDEKAADIIDSVKYGKTSLYVTEGKAFPIGVAMDNYLFANELFSLPKEQRGIALMHGAVIFSSDEDKVRSYMNHIDVNSIDYEGPIDDLITDAEKNAVKDFSRDAHGFQCTSDYDTDKIVYFSVPNDLGWTATIDNKKATIIDSGGMMLLLVPKGKHSIKFSYFTYGLKLGIVLSVVSWMLFIAFFFITYFRNRSTS